MRVVATALLTLVLCTRLARAAGATNVVKLNSVRLYLPDATMKERVTDIGPLAEYVKALQHEAAAFWQSAPRPAAKGLLVAVGVRPGQTARVWCDGVAGDIPADTLASVRAALEHVKPVSVKNGPIAFALELGLWDQMPAEFPVMPNAWADAAKRSKRPLSVPDELFKVIWPE